MFSILSTITTVISTVLIIRDNPYLDPGSGSFIIQLIIASLLGAALVFRTSWSKIKSFFKRTPDQTDAELEIEEDNEE